MRPETLPRPKSSVVLREVPGGGAILFCTDTELYFSLNRSGLQVWQLLASGCQSETELVERLALGYPDVSEPTLATDVRTVISQLTGSGLVESPQPTC